MKHAQLGDAPTEVDTSVAVASGMTNIATENDLLIDLVYASATKMVMFHEQNLS